MLKSHHLNRFAGRSVRRFAPLATMLAIAAALAGAVSPDANALTVNFTDGRVAKVFHVCGYNYAGGLITSRVRTDTYASARGLYVKTRRVLNNTVYPESTWSELPVGSRAGADTVFSTMTLQFFNTARLQVNLGAWVFGKWAESGWYWADTYTYSSLAPGFVFMGNGAACSV